MQTIIFFMTKQKLVATMEIFNFKKEEKGLLKQPSNP